MSRSSFTAGHYVYTVFTATGEMLPAPSVAAAVEEIRARYPTAHFGRWMDVWRAKNMPAWPGAGSELRYELGEREDRIRPIAYVRVQEWELSDLAQR